MRGRGPRAPGGAPQRPAAPEPCAPRRLSLPLVLQAAAAQPQVPVPAEGPGAAGPVRGPRRVVSGGGAGAVPGPPRGAAPARLPRGGSSRLATPRSRLIPGL